MTLTNRDELRTALANYAHEAWSGWMRYLFRMSRQNVDNSWTISHEFATRWGRQVATAFFDLPEDEKPSDYEEADKILALVESHLADDDGQRVLDGDPSTDRAWLEDLADQLEQSQDDNIAALAKEHGRKLRSIAIGCDQLALEKLRLAKLEEQVDRKLCEHLEYLLGTRDDRSIASADIGMLQVAATWLLSRRTQQQGTKSALGAGLGALGACILGSGFGFDRKFGSETKGSEEVGDNK